MKNSSLHTAEKLLKEMEAYYLLGLQLSSEVQLRPFDDLMNQWGLLEAVAARCELLMEKLEKNPLQDNAINEKLLEQARKNSNLMAALSQTLEKEKEKVAQEISKISHVLKSTSSSESSFRMSL